MADMRIVVAGAGGRMGRTLARAVIETSGLTLAGAFEEPGSRFIGHDVGELCGVGKVGIPISSDIAAVLKNADGVIDFTVPAATREIAAKAAAQGGLVHVVGTTGLSEDDEAKIKAASQKTTIVKSGNMSLGVNLLAALVKRVAKTLDEEFDIEVLEMHHRNKIDAPSGTALLLGRAAADGRGIDLAKHNVMARQGHTGARRSGDIGFATLRGGSVIGDHSVIFAGPAERIELSHRAEDRGIYARGALKAALWARGKAPGLYDMNDVLGLKDF